MKRIIKVSYKNETIIKESKIRDLSHFESQLKFPTHKSQNPKAYNRNKVKANFRKELNY